MAIQNTSFSAKRLPKTLRWGVALALCLLIAAGFRPWALWGDNLRASLVAQVAKASGLDVEVGGTALFAVLPRPRLTINDVHIHDLADGMSLSAPSVTVDLRLLSLLFGHLEFDHADFHAPAITIDLERPTLRNFGFLRRLLRARTLAGSKTGAAPASMSSVTLRNAKVRVISTTANHETLIEDIQLDANWDRPGAPLALAGRGRWNDVPFDVSVWISRPDATLAGAASPVSFRANSPAGALALRGNLAGGPDSFFIGTLTASTTVPEKLQGLAGDMVPLGSSPISLQADINASARAVVMTDLKLGINGGQYDGALALRQDGETPVVSGTLATNTLQLEPFLTRLPPPTSDDGAWSEQSVQLAHLPLVDLDLRLSAGVVALGRWQAEDAAFAVQLRKGQLNVELAEATALGGSIRGHFAMAPDVSKPDVRMQATALGVDMAQWCAVVACPLDLTGKLALDMSVRASGQSFRDWTSSLDGTIDVNASQGSFSGPDIEQMLRRIEKRPFSIALDLRKGRTLYETASASATLSHGIAIITDGSIAGPATLLHLGGSAEIAAQTLALSGNARQTAPDGGARSDGPVLNFSLTGPWRALAATMEAGQPSSHMTTP